jgi:hypothetical protein
MRHSYHSSFEEDHPTLPLFNSNPKKQRSFSPKLPVPVSPVSPSKRVGHAGIQREASVMSDSGYRLPMEYHSDHHQTELRSVGPVKTNKLFKYV